MRNRSQARRHVLLVLEWTPMAVWLAMAIALVAA